MWRRCGKAGRQQARVWSCVDQLLAICCAQFDKGADIDADLKVHAATGAGLKAMEDKVDNAKNEKEKANLGKTLDALKLEVWPTCW